MSFLKSKSSKSTKIEKSRFSNLKRLIRKSFRGLQPASSKEKLSFSSSVTNIETKSETCVSSWRLHGNPQKRAKRSKRWRRVLEVTCTD